MKLSGRPVRIDVILFVLAALFLLVIGTSAAVYYTAPKYRPYVPSVLKDAFRGVIEWKKQQEEERRELAAMKRDQNSQVIGKVVRNEPDAFRGYTLYTSVNEHVAHLVDMEGNVVHEWSKTFREAFPNPAHVTNPKGRIYWSEVVAFPNGDLLAQYHGRVDTPYGYGMVKIDKDSNVLWTYQKNTHHVFNVAPDGKIYGLSQRWYKKTIPGYKGIINPPALLDSVFVLTPDGEEITTVDLVDAFRGTPYQKLLHVRNAEARKSGDYWHTNSVYPLKEGVPYTIPGVKPGMVLVSIRNPSVLAIIDLEAKRTVWATRGPWKQQHDAYFTPEGNIRVFDNQGWGQHRTRVLEVDPLTLKETWAFPKQKRYQFYSGARGMSSLLPNGNTLIVKSENSSILEVTPDGRPVWEMLIYRRYANGEKQKVIVANGTRYGEDALPFLANLETRHQTSRADTGDDDLSNLSEPDPADF